MTSTYYCTPADVAAFLMFNQPEGFTDTTKPTIDQVADVINRTEDEIDRFCATSFRRDAKQIKEYEYHNIETRYRWFTGIAVYLRYRPAKIILNESEVENPSIWDSKIDTVEIWDGANYTPLGDQDRSRNWWIDIDMGIVYLRSYLYLRRPMGLRVKYHYGYNYCPGDIKRACVYLSAVDLISGEDRSVLLPEGTDNLKYGEKVDLWQKRAEEILLRYREYRVAGEIF